ncbi:fungal specific transcription factor domain-containing protein [Colletotrichum scovillei]|uniref:fungal specific transcription factor domain-containing protein n=1 Tax=Colletotrichum scovillei TaxID=1209932 RepID=UPI0015C2DB48|nr:fungal specific transcription factor domain-containing protein [Colletotrichum scovillei]KAF4784262.1 fungal specific transcription factor domain-containing protein [Colletotrichum scovillei]
MTPTPPSTTPSSGSGRSPEEQFRVREGGDASSCSYATPATRKKNQSQGSSSPDDMQNRIDRLEGLVLSLMHGGATIDPSTAAAAAAVTGASNQIRASHVYCQEHWHTILADISEVKTYFANHKKDLEKSYEKVMMSKPASAREGPTFLLGAAPATEIELRAELPPKSAVLALCSRYFNSMDNAVNIIHAPTFQQQLRAHWQDPSKTPIMWLGLLYSILCLAMLSYHKVGDEPPEWKGRTLDLASEYRLRTVQCLIAADYTKPVEYTVETMLLYVFGEYSSRWDADLGLWLIVSLLTRVAFRMGYHRDAKWFPTITPFQAEMRRRTWALVRMADVVFSHQVSLPSMIYGHDCDTQLPNNIFDEEFGPNTKVLPPSRPKTEPTPIAYMIAKSKLCNEMGDILQATNRVGRQLPYDEILRFDARLREINDEIPPHLKVAALEGSHDPVTLIIARFNINVLYLKILCLLHKKYVPRARTNPRYAYSRRSAVEAALETLRHLVTLDRESQPSGRLRSLRWFVNSIATKDFLLPAMLVALDLHHDRVAETSDDRRASESAMFWTPEQRMEMLSNLERTKEIWQGLADGSMEAFKASKIFKNESFPGFETNPEMQSDHNAAMTLGMLSGGMTPNTAAALESSMQSTNSFSGMDFGVSLPMTGPGMTPNFQGDIGMNNAGSPFSMFTNFESGGDFPANFDWNAFETYTQNANWAADTGFGQIYPGQSSPETDSNGMPFGNANGGMAG